MAESEERVDGGVVGRGSEDEEEQDGGCRGPGETGTRRHSSVGARLQCGRTKDPGNGSCTAVQTGLMSWQCTHRDD